MRVVLTNAHKNPIVLDCPWMTGEEGHAMLNNRETLMFSIPHPAHPDSDPIFDVVFGREPLGDATKTPNVEAFPAEFYVDVQSEDGVERIWSYICDPGEYEVLGQFGHHPDAEIDSNVEVERLTGLLAEAHGGLLRALDFQAGSPTGQQIKSDVRNALERSGYTGNLGVVGSSITIKKED